MTETPQPDPWAKVKRYSVGAVEHHSVDSWYASTEAEEHPEGNWLKSSEVDAARAADAARLAEQAETIRQLQAQVSRFEHVHGKIAPIPKADEVLIAQAKRILELEAQIAALTQERDEEARAFKRAAKDRDICRQKRVDLEARCATLTAALEELYATVKGECPSLLNEDSGGSAQLDAQVSAALAVAPQGGTPK